LSRLASTLVAAGSDVGFQGHRIFETSMYGPVILNCRARSDHRAQIEDEADELMLR